MAEDVLDRAPENRIADRGVTQIAILRVNGDVGAAQRRFIARKAGAQQPELPALRVQLRGQPLAFLPQPGSLIVLGLRYQCHGDRFIHIGVTITSGACARTVRSIPRLATIFSAPTIIAASGLILV